MDQRFCTECGAPLEEGARFCSECGAIAQREEPTDEQPTTEGPAAEQAIVEEAAAEEPVIEGPAVGQPVMEQPTVEEPPVGQPAAYAPPAYVPPAYGAPAPQPQAAAGKPVKKKPALPVRILLAAVSALLCVLLFACLCAGGVLYTARSAITPEAVNRMVDDVDLLNQDIRPFINSDEIPASQEVTVADYFYEAYKSAYSRYSEEQLNITREEMKELLEDSTLGEFIKDKINDYLADATGDTGTGRITKQEIMDLVEENEELISKASGGYIMTDEDYDLISAQLDELDITKTLDLSTVRREQELPFILAGHLTSWYALAAVGFVCLIWILLLFLVNKYRVSNVLLYTGIALLGAGLVGAAAKLLQTTLIRRISEAASLSRDLVRPVAEDLIGLYWQIALYAIAAGALLILIFAVISLIRRRKADRI